MEGNSESVFISFPSCLFQRFSSSNDFAVRVCVLPWYHERATRFYTRAQGKYVTGEAANEIGSYQPKAGSCIIFNQCIVHDGEELFSGDKYIMRTEVMFRRKP